MKKYYFTVLLLFMITLSANAQQIIQLSFYSPLISTFDAQYTRNHLVISQDGLLIFDVSQPTKQPKQVSKTSYPGSIANTLAVQGNYAYMAQGGNGIFAVYDISDFKDPVLTGSVSIPSTAFTAGDLAPYGDYVYMVSFDSIYVVNVANKTLPKLVRTVHVRNPGSTGADALAINGNALFVRTPFSTEVYAITNPNKPVFVNKIPNTHTSSRGLAVDTVHHRLFTPWVTALQEFLGFDAYDISNPLAPKFLFADSTAFGSGEFGISAYSYTNDVLYITRSGTINAFDVSDTSHGFVTQFSGQDVPNSSVSVQVKDSIFYNIKRGGFEVLKYTNSAEAFCPASMYLKSRVEGKKAFLRWDKIEGAEGYLVRYRAASSETWSDEMFTTDNKDTLRHLQPNTQYFWNVKTVCSTTPPLQSTWARKDEFFITAQDVDELISFAPNPVQDVLRVQVKSPDVAQLVVTDLAGNAMLAQSAKADNTLLFSKMHTGAYVLQVLNKERQVIGSVKIFKQ